tara:strand:+ start:995 stop:1798 length:804 start_codon:yes stop_codon:yes gene_type:complete
LSNFLQRAITGILFVALLMGAIFYGHISTAIIFVVIALLGWKELANLIHIPTGGAHFTYAIFTLILWSSIGFSSTPLALVNTILISFLVVALTRSLFQQKFNTQDSGKEVFAFIYLNLPFVSLFSMGWDQQSEKFSPITVLMIFFMVWANDTGAYLTGRAIGKHKMYPKLSPGKTWEGTVGGVIISMLITYILAEYVFDLDYQYYLGAAFITGTFATLGDLFESKMKRERGIKDSGNLLPGHGGILDRFDALFLAAPANYIYFILVH